MEVNQRFLEDLECPVCRDIMEAPIRNCAVGHSICDSCYNNVTTCPLCRGEMSGGRNYYLEDLGRSLTYKCTNQWDGCDFEACLEEVKEHNKFCKYTICECPLKCIDSCKWSGKIQDIMRHCHKNHPNNTYFTTKQKLICRDFLELEDECVITLKHYYIMFEAYGDLFKIMWDLNCSSGFMLWRVIYIGPHERALKYRFSLDFQNPLNVHDNLHLDGQCQPMDLKKIATSSMYIPTTQRDLISYCLDDDLHYTVSIFKVSDEESGEIRNSHNAVSNICTFAPQGCICRF